MGVFFTGRVQIREGHTLIRTGLYSRIRHPAYAGSLLAYFGLGLAFSNWWTLTCNVLPYLVAIGYRIHVEEAVLRETASSRRPISRTLTDGDTQRTH